MTAYLEKTKELQSTFDEFTVSQVPRENNSHADALANLGSSIQTTSPKTIPMVYLQWPAVWKKEEEEEVNDVANEKTWMTPIIEYLEKDVLPEDKNEARRVKAQAARFSIIRGKLYKRSYSGPYLRCVNPAEAKYILAELHEGECGNHSGGRSLAHRALTQGYYWPTMRADSSEYTRRCDKCQRFAQVSHQPPERLTSITSPWPFMKWGMDIVGKLPTAHRRRYPQANGQAESSNKTIMNTIKKRLENAKGRWVDELPGVLWSYRTTARTSTGETPFSLAYGMEVVIPTESEVPTARHELTTEMQNWEDMCHELDTVDERRERASIRMAAYQQCLAKHYNKNARTRSFKVGDWVLRRVFQNTKEAGAGKLAPTWEGPYLITKVVGNGAYKIQTDKGRDINNSWNAIHLKQYHT
ncbi:uncharacterized protein LOC133038318 [Cannabis sativa]|uniref:uncharacterized protein LOC133038318 n=1 Tax=Cannabis sativa TaxID=3483 RepID=UPI0029CA75FB|nr:uncharacterized protein LOC133038318 [Cannabis sativa]